MYEHIVGRMSDVGVANLATHWREAPMPPLEGEVPNEREAEGFVR